MGDVEMIEVWTISGFIDPSNPTADASVEGWLFLIQPNAMANTNKFERIPIPDNHLLIQPTGMQSCYRHAVKGQVSKYIRWVITVREVNSNVLQKLCTKDGKVNDVQVIDLMCY